MRTPNTPPESRFTRRRTPRYRALPPVAIIAWVALVAAGCGGGSANSGVAHLGTSATPTSTGAAAVSGSPSPEAYATCMRSHGVPTFPDPNSKGQLDASKVANLNSPQYRKAQEVCRSLAPSGQSHLTQGGSLTQQQLAQFLAFARCMRAHGVSNFPDPTAKGLSLSGVDPNTPRFQAAQRACRLLLPNRGQGNVHSTGGSAKP